MKSLTISLFIILSVSGCYDLSQEKKPVSLNAPVEKNTLSLMGSPRQGTNPNSIANKAIEKQKERANRLEISKINSDAKIEIAKIESNNKVKIAKVNAVAKTDVAKTDSSTKIQTSKIDAVTKKDDIQNQFYITMAIVGVFLIGLFLLYFNGRKNRELKNRLHQEQLTHEIHLKEREHEEKRLEMMLGLVASGKLSSEMETEIITSLTRPESAPESKLIES